MDDNRTGYTVITREPLWSDDDRARALALDKYERSLCPCGCGVPVDEAFNPKRQFSVETGTCYARKTIESVKRKAHKQAEDRNKPEGWDDGLFWFVDENRIDPTLNGGERG